ncbi:MAG: redoxin domain-containing protein [Bacteroidales bacterium]|nr:redoxin domain-containing protein [Bacteroidales bacterium]
MIINKRTQENRLSQKIKVLPNFTFKSLDNHLITPDSISSDRNTIIMLYSSDCLHCYNIFDQMVNLISEMPTFQILMVSSDSLETISEFKEKFDLDPGMPIKFYQCDKAELAKLFGHYNYPTLYYYDQGKHLIKKITQNIDADNLRVLIKSGN